MHGFEGRKSLRFKHVVETVFERSKEAFTWVTIPQRSVCCFLKFPSELPALSHSAVTESSKPTSSHPSSGPRRKLCDLAPTDIRERYHPSRPNASRLFSTAHSLTKQS